MKQTTNQTISRPKAAPNRQKSAESKGATTSAASTSKTKKKRSWPILEAAFILVLFKISLGAYYMLTGDSVSQMTQDTGSMLNSATQLNNGIQQGTSSVPPAASTSSRSRLDEYLAVISPAVARAAPAPTTYSAISAGAMMVMASQSTAPEAARSSLASIPLPPNSGDLRRPAAGTSSTDAAAKLEQSRDGAAKGGSLRVREQELARREELLFTREQALSGLEAELNQRLVAIETSRSELDALTRRNEAIVAEQKALLEEQKTEDQNLRDARLQHLVSAYGGMKAEQAGRLVNSLDEDVAVAILAAMPGRKAGQILGMVDADKAARLTKAISDQRIDPNLLLAEQSGQ